MSEKELVRLVARCSTHPNSRAAWHCTQCSKNLCPQCAVEYRIQGVGIVRCVHCGQSADELTVPYRVPSFGAMTPKFLATIFSPRGILHLASLGFMLQLVSYASMVPLLGTAVFLLLYYGLFGSYFFLVVQAAARGDAALPTLAEVTSQFSYAAQAALRFFLATAIVWLPMFLYMFGFVSPQNIPSGVFLLLKTPVVGGFLLMWRDPVVIVIVLVGALGVPSMLLLAAAMDSVLSILNPMKVFAVAAKFPGTYLLAAGVAFVLYACSVLLRFFLAYTLAPFCMLQFASTFGKLWLVESVTLIPLVLIGFILGWLLHQRGDLFGMRAERDLCVPAYPNAKPQGSLPEQKPENSSGRRKGGPVEPISLD
jgi:hypothetical protein